MIQKCGKNASPYMEGCGQSGGDLHCTRGIREMSDPAAEAGEKWGTLCTLYQRLPKAGEPFADQKPEFQSLNLAG